MECEYTPIGVDFTDNSVTFENAAGEESIGNETCCELYGYTWNGSGCYNNQSPGTPQPFFNGGQSGNTARSSSRGGTGFMQGIGNTSSHSSLFNNINAINSTLTDGVTASIIAGEGHTVGNGVGVSGVLVTGQNANAFEEGRHFGGRNQLGDPIGLIQSGEILMHVSDTTWSSTTSKNLLVNGGYLNIPVNTMWSAKVLILVEEWNAATSVYSAYKTIDASANLYKNGVTAVSSAWTIHSQIGTLGTFSLATDAATDTTQHRLQITYAGTTISRPVKVTCRLTYVQTVE